MKEYVKDKIQLSNMRYRLGYHIMAPSGWINDPNGFCYFQGYYHIFYQHYPNDAQWGPMHWGHARSKDLVHWETLPIALTPGDKEDEDGCFSGSAVVYNDKMYLIYTGHHYIGDGNPDHFWQNQNLAISEDGINFKKYENNPIIAQAPEDNTQHFRDPKVWYNNGIWYLILGSQGKDELGRVLLYKSPNLINWNLVGPVTKSSEISKEGYMWECPDFFHLGDFDFLLMSPQGILEDNGKFKNENETGYMVGKYNYEKNEYQRGGFSEIDNGHDFYASQTTLTPDGRRIVIGWMDMWGSEMPESNDGWAGALTIPRELIYENNILQMRPIKELERLRERKLLDSDISFIGEKTIVNNDRQYEALLSFDSSDLNGTGIELKDSDDNLILDLKYFDGKMILNRGGKDSEREATVNLSDHLELHLFVDTSSVEIFVNNGERTFTERFYADKAQLNVVSKNSTDVSVVVYKLDKEAVKF
ncbi:glycoside hydrolase family 32 protein [Companilactobacillus sp. HBUAS56257]|jgi:beta-fructofuranosidase|uniref:glycoside hydrolase family 32 protein n=1 Tax=Companilactobacillus sp. HBUAS56257 TaxID=3109360 RepID=UPI002FF0D67E